jgi:diadenosine tetraphosphate (Ap4A) HIT family hydrolase
MTDWKARVSGENCPFDLPRPDIAESLIKIEQLSISTLFLERIQTYRGHCVLVFDPRHVTRIDELAQDEWLKLSMDIQLAERALMRVFQPDHINIASLGQVVPHLHWHLIPRYQDDPRWGGPIWMTNAEEMPKVYLEERDYAARAEEIRRELVKAGS